MMADSGKLCPGCFQTDDSSKPAVISHSPGHGTNNPSVKTASLSMTGLPPCPHCGYPDAYRQPAMSMMPGIVLNGRYRIGRVLGSGGFGITYLAWDEKLAIRVAIKEYLPNTLATRREGDTAVLVRSESEESDYQHFKACFLEEARLLARFNQEPGIVSVLDHFDGNGTVYIVMNHVDGETLEVYLHKQGGRMGFAEASALLRPVMVSLSRVHEAGLIHRDISPENLFITREGQVRLLDFGAARSFERTGDSKVSVLLKRGYAPPEQYRSNRDVQGPWTDVYALAAVLYRMTTGQMPADAIERLQGVELTPPSSLGVAMHKHVEAILLRAMSLDPATRPQTMMALCEGLSDEQQDITQNEPAKREHTVMLKSAAGTPEPLGEIGPGSGSRITETGSPVRTGWRKWVAYAAGAVLLLVLTWMGVSYLKTTAETRRTQESTGGGIATGDAKDQEGNARVEATPQEGVPAVDGELSADGSQPMRISDSALEAALRVALHKPTGDILGRDSWKLRNLALRNKGIRNIEPLQHFANLVQLDLSENQISDASPLRHLKKLQQLNLSRNELVGVEGLDACTSLTNLDILGNRIPDLSPLAGMTQLVALTAGENPLVDVGPLSELTQLKHLNVNASGVTDISSLTKLTQLNSAYLNSTRIQSIEVASHWTLITELEISDTMVADLSPLASCPNLIHLWVRGTPVTDIRALSDLKSLRTLYLENTQVTDFSPIGHLFGQLTDVDFQMK